MTTLFLKEYYDQKNGHLVDLESNVIGQASLDEFIEDIRPLIGSSTVDVYESVEDDITPDQYTCILNEKLPSIENWLSKEIERLIKSLSGHSDCLSEEEKKGEIYKLGNLINTLKLINKKIDILSDNDRVVLQLED